MLFLILFSCSVFFLIFSLLKQLLCFIIFNFVHESHRIVSKIWFLIRLGSYFCDFAFSNRDLDARGFSLEEFKCCLNLLFFNTNRVDYSNFNLVLCGFVVDCLLIYLFLDKFEFLLYCTFFLLVVCSSYESYMGMCVLIACCVRFFYFFYSNSEILFWFMLYDLLSVLISFKSWYMLYL